MSRPKDEAALDAGAEPSSDVEIDLEPAAREALKVLADIPRRAAFVPPREQRRHFQTLVGLGLARSFGQGLGGEGFGSTPAGRRAAHGGPLSMRHPKLARGFAVMNLERRREIARLGGKSVPAQERAFSRDRALAAQAGKAGGQASFAGRRRTEPNSQ